MTQRFGGIGFGQGVPWGAYNQRELSRWARSPDLSPLALRVLFAALGRHDATGHARFGPGELAGILSSPDRTTGEMVPARRASVSRAVGAAKELDFLGSQSMARCLVLPSHVFQQGGIGAPCSVHGQ